ncbi:MAG: hypothetical protein J0H06_00310, partial [Actinobacteria bacterium]|nr:hypothetical protein [Actinomycetota bacterium]
MQSLRHLLQRPSTRTSFGAAAIFAALVTALSLATAAGAKPPARIITDVFAVTYDAKVTYRHHLALPEYRETQAVTYKLHGRLPEVTFTDGRLEVDKSAVINTAVKGKATVEAEQDDGEWLSCGGTDIDVRGIVGIARIAKGLWLLPAHSAAPSGTCISSEGAR